jgi:hypothetical protein
MRQIERIGEIADPAVEGEILEGVEDERDGAGEPGIDEPAGGFVFEVAAARALDAAPRGWRLSFNFLPGF